MKSKPSPATPQKKSWRVLAGELQTTDRSLRLWRGRPGAPKEPDAQQWRAFMAREGLGRGRTGELTELRAQVETEKLRKLRRENEIAEGRLLPMEVLGPVIAARAHSFAANLRFVLETELPPLLQGADIATMRGVLREANDRLVDRYNSKYDPAALVAEVTNEPTLS